MNKAQWFPWWVSEPEEGDRCAKEQPKREAGKFAPTSYKGTDVNVSNSAWKEDGEEQLCR